MMPSAALSLLVTRSRGTVETPQTPQDLGNVTVVIPCYRYGRYLPGAVAAALDQSGVEVDVIIVDDASPDDSGEVAEELAAGDPRVQVIRHRTNAGHIATYNDGLAAATGEWVTLVSADDLLTRDSLARSAALLRSHPGVGLVYGTARHFSGSAPVPSLDVRSWIVWSGRDWLAARCRGGNNVIASPEVVMRRSVLTDVGGYRSDLPHSGDLEMWMRTAAVADIGYLVGPDQALYRQHESNMHDVVFRSSEPSAAVADLEHRWAAFQAVLGGPAAGGLRDVAELRRTARSTLAAQALDGAASAHSHGFTDVADSYVRLATAIAGSDRVPRATWPRIARRARGAATSVTSAWRLRQVGI